MRRVTQLICGLLAIRWQLPGHVLLFTAGLACAQTGSTVKYRSAEYTFKVSSTRAEHDGNERSVRWEYPVLVAGEAKARAAVNSWLRRLSLEVLAGGAEASIDILLKKTDRQVMQFLAHDQRFVESGVGQSAVTPSDAFGSFISFTHNTEWVGQTRPQHGVQTFIFNTVTVSPIEVESLFNSDALEDLNAALAEAIQATRPDCQGRHFRWSQLTLHPPSMVGIEFPYDPAEWRDCGDGIEVIEGDVVVRQLLNAAALSPILKFEKVK